MQFFESFANINISEVTSYIRTFGVLAPLVAFILFALQAAIPIFPYIILAAAGGMLFGLKWGFLLSWLGALAGACLAFGLCRLLGGDWARKTIKYRLGYDVRAINSEMAFWSILIARLIPVIPTPAINVAAALSEIPFWNFFFSSALGKMPTAILYTGLGIYLFNVQDIKEALFIIVGVLIALVGIRYLVRDRVNLFNR